jgi:hypothetical protein
MGTRHLYWILTGPSFAVRGKERDGELPPYLPNQTHGFILILPYRSRRQSHINFQITILHFQLFLTHISIKSYLKGVWHEIFSSWFFFTNPFPHGPEYPTGAISNFDDREYIRMFCASCAEAERSVRHLKPPEQRLRMNFSKTFIYRCIQADDIRPTVLSPVQLTPTINHRRHRCYRR